MSSHFWLTEEQYNKIRPLLPNTPRGVPRVDDRRVLSVIIFCIQRGYRWSDVPPEYGPAKTLYNRWKRWSEAGVFEHVFETLARETADLSTLMIDASHVKTHRIAANGAKKTPAKDGISARQKAG
ncbi:transposase [Aliiroseovarius crassostreae]|uniref:Transposase n=1 Tax=Aliiroseovarius crassostreae TaxID=154981 RepID=A0A0P7KLF3_9RHOB|nr:transposase [Aliiroseovarius crassostreae]